MKLLIAIIFALYDITLSYKMGELITCLEQNEEIPFGYKEKLTYLNPESTECQNNPELCRIYKEDEPYPSQGDVCDHEDPITHTIRDSCKFAVMFGEKENANKTWTWKCAALAICPIPGQEGCLINNKRIQCCCQSDYCNDNELYQKYAVYGRADKWPPNFDEILAIPTGDINVIIDIPGYEGYEVNNNVPVPETETETETDTGYGQPIINVPYVPPQQPELPPQPLNNWPLENPFANNYGEDARGYMYAHKGYNNVDGNMEGNNNGISVAQLLLIFAYFIIGTVCLGMGVCIGVRWKSNVQKEQEQWNDM